MLLQQEYVNHRHACVHNEVVLRPLNDSLPHAIAAVFVQPHCLGTSELAAAHGVWTALLRRYDLNEVSTPVVLYDPRRRIAGRPFSDAAALMRNLTLERLRQRALLGAAASAGSGGGSPSAVGPADAVL